MADPQELEKVEAELQALRISEAGLARYIATNQALLSRIPAAKSGMEKLDLEVKNKKALYDQLMARHGQSEVSKQMEVQDKTTNFRIVDPAILPVKPVSPNRVKIILMGIVAGLAGSFGILFALDQLDPAIRSIDTLKGMGLSVMAVIPRIRVEEELQKERKRDRRLYLAASSYFAVILLVLATEALGYSLVERLFQTLKGS
jgi:polysaccharide chain length determinant protein (PEP-CTERM system associated)